jgi:hypothetical protein
MSELTPEPEQVYLQLRSRTLGLTPEEVSLAPTGEAPHVWSVLMETGYEVGFATLVSLADGTTSLYYSTGGGMLGSGDYAPLAKASRALVAQAELLLDSFAPTSDFPLPGVGQVRFILRTFSDTLSTAASVKSLTEVGHPLTPLFTRAQNVLTQLRLSAEQKRT